MYLGINFYNRKLYLSGCLGSSSFTAGIMKIYKGSTIIDYIEITDQEEYDYIYYSSLAAGNYTFWVNMDWQTNAVPDYTFKIYSS